MPARPCARLSALAVLLASPFFRSTLHAQAVRYELVPAQSRVWFDASATMGRFQGVAQQVSGWADVRDTVAYGGTRGQIDVGAGSFRTGVALRNQHLRNEMEVERYPFVRFVLEGATPGEAGVLVLRGRLVVKDRSTPVAIRARTTRSAGEVVLDGELPTKFTELGMRPPTRMGGLTRVRDDFVIHFRAVFRRK
jgi:polyisoprenoid-binding protein YceI